MTVEKVNDHTPTETLPDNPVSTREAPALSVSYVKDGFTFTIRIPLHNLERDMGKLIARIRAVGGEPHMPKATPPTSKEAPKAAQKQRRTMEPLYLDDGTPTCPRHHEPLHESKFGPGHYCRAHETDPAWASTTGYCNIRFPAPPKEHEDDDIPF
jgi:hypothetical protein